MGQYNELVPIRTSIVEGLISKRPQRGRTMELSTSGNVQSGGQRSLRVGHEMMKELDVGISS
jgi:hypothetical protein